VPRPQPFRLERTDQAEFLAVLREVGGELPRDVDAVTEQVGRVGGFWFDVQRTFLMFHVKHGPDRRDGGRRWGRGDGQKWPSLQAEPARVPR
jgi:hypothetical protein